MNGLGISLKEMNLLFAALLCWYCLGCCRGDHGCILSETSTRKATITEGFPGTIYLLPEGRFDRVFLRLFMERSDVGLNVKTITMKREDLPQSKKMQEIIVSIDSEGHPTMSLPDITERTFACCPNYEIEKLEVESEGGGVWLFYRCPEAVNKERLHRITGCGSEAGDAPPLVCSSQGRPRPAARVWVPLVLALLRRRIGFA
ncbi:uncharacterized protein [Penaeus vannamei]|uniref:uncharacterized protein isoform X2 n=1 Tax=Penaeus vannamei TaxID=6689 RepID=UPI00387F5585